MAKLLPRLIEKWAEGRLPLHRSAEFDNVVLAHPRQPVKPLGGIGRYTRDDEGSVNTISQPRRACQRVRPTTGPSGNETTISAKGIELRFRIGGDISHAAPGVACLIAVARTRCRHEPQPKPGRGGHHRAERQDGAGCAVVINQHSAIGRATLKHVEFASVGQPKMGPP